MYHLPCFDGMKPQIFQFARKNLIYVVIVIRQSELEILKGLGVIYFVS